MFICLFENILYLFRGYVSDVTYVKGLSSHEFWPNGKNYQNVEPYSCLNLAIIEPSCILHLVEGEIFSDHSSIVNIDQH